MSAVSAGADTVRVILPAALVALFPAADRVVAVPSGTVAEVIAALDDRWPGMADRLCDGRPALRRHMNVFVAGERATLRTEVPPGADVHILLAISGG